MTDVIPIIGKVLNPLMAEHKMQSQFPMPVWDDSGELVGVTIRQDKRMLDRQDCVAEASFVLTPADLRDDARIAEKANLAIACIKSEVQMHIRPKRKMKAS
jgi:hypothetical protein